MNSFLILLVIFFPTESHSKNTKCSTVSIPPVSHLVMEENQQVTRDINRQSKLFQLSIAPTLGKKAEMTLNHSLGVLDMTIQIAKSVCPNKFVSHNHLIDTALSIFIFLHDNSGDIRYFGDPIKPFMFTRIASALTACQKTALPEGTYFSTGAQDSECSAELSSGRIERICSRNLDYDLDVEKCRKLKLRKERRKSSNCFQNTNIIIDIVWSVVEVVHAACLKEFRKRGDISAYHMWEQALEGLFTRKIRKYWYQAPLSVEEYQTILHPNIREQVYNLVRKAYE